MIKIAWVISLVSLGFIQNIYASALEGATCSVKAEVVHTEKEQVVLDSGRISEHFYLDLRILEAKQEPLCPVSVGQVYRAIDNHPGALKVGDKLTAGLELASNMTPSGAVNYLSWSKMAYDNGQSIIDKNKQIIDYIQSDDQSLE